MATVHHRPSDYDPTFHDEEGYRFALLGYTVKEMASLFGHSQSTMNRWFKQHPTFWESVTRGRVQADALVAEGLFKKATGFKVPETLFFVVRNVTGAEGIEEVQTDKYYPPDAGAALNWLKNRQPEKWRDKIDLGLPPVIQLTMNLEGDAPPKESDE